MTRRFAACSPPARWCSRARAAVQILPAPHGGPKELELVVATKARDVPRVQQLLSTGADPNGMVAFEGSSHSAWEYSLTQMRTRYPDTVEIVLLMIKAGAKPESAWGGGVANGIAPARRKTADPDRHAEPERRGDPRAAGRRHESAASADRRW